MLTQRITHNKQLIQARNLRLKLVMRLSSTLSKHFCHNGKTNILNSEYENRIVQEAVQPNGARLKQSDAILNELCKACESLPAEIVGSILFYNLSAPIVWASKAVIFPQ